MGELGLPGVAVLAGGAGENGPPGALALPRLVVGIGGFGRTVQSRVLNALRWRSGRKSPGLEVREAGGPRVQGQAVSLPFF